MIWLEKMTYRKNLVSFEEFKPCIEKKGNESCIENKDGLFDWLKKGYDAIQDGLDTDKVIVIAGKERRGKSTLATRIIYKLDPTFDVNNIVFKGNTFRRLSKTTKKGIISIDEGGNVLYSGDTMTTDSKKTIKRIMEMGCNNNLVFILIPDYLRLNKNIRTRRVGALIYITNKGRFYTFTERSARKIGKQGSFKGITPYSSGRWNETESTEGLEKLWKDYKELESDHKNRLDDDEKEEVEEKPLTERDMQIKYNINLKREDVTQEMRAKTFGVSVRTIQNWDRKEREAPKDTII